MSTGIAYFNCGTYVVFEHLMPLWLSILLALLIVIGDRATAQVVEFTTPPPQATAAGTVWFANRAPIFYAGDFYYPAGAAVFFDGQVMARTGVLNGVPLYEDRTLEPYSIVFVPAGGKLMQPYERRRAGNLAGTNGSRTPSFPVAVASTLGAPSDESVALQENDRGESECPPEIGTASGGIETIPPPTANRGVWIEFNGARWFSAGRAVPLTATGFTQVGSLGGAPVYRADGGRDDRVYVTVAPGALVAPYRR